MVTTSEWLGLMAAALVASSFIASPELRAFAANTVGSADIINNSILSADIKDGEVKATDIATNAVGASEIAADSVGGSELTGITKLVFGQCNPTSGQKNTVYPDGFHIVVTCNINGVDTDDSAVAFLNDSNIGWDIRDARVLDGKVEVAIFNECCLGSLGSNTSIAVVVYDK